MRAAALVVLAVAAGTANLADARSLGASYLFSTDTDDNDIHRHTVNGWEPVSAHFDIGASASRTTFVRHDRHAVRGGVQYDLRDGALASRGDIGVEHLAGRDYLTGDLVVETYRGAWTLAAGLERTLVDSERGIALGLAATTAYVMADWSADTHGAALVLARTAYSDTNDRNRLRTRLWQSVCDCGVYVQVAGETYSNSQPYTGNYFSPERYTRALGGIGVRRRVAAGTFSARAEYGVQRVDGEQHPSHTLTARFESARSTEGWQWSAEFIHDRKQPGYNYLQAQATLIKRF
jgi:hypothetical protein